MTALYVTKHEPEVRPVLEAARPARRDPTHPRADADWRFALRCLRRDTTNFAVLKHRNFQGFIVTAKNSGTHWLTYALNLALAAQYKVPPPRYSDSPSSDDIIGHPKHGRAYAHLPRIASTHSIPHKSLDWDWVHSTAVLPKYVVVVRDLRDALTSYYVKWHSHYQVPFETFIEGDPWGKRFRCDVWWYIHFLNRWGEIAARMPERVLVVRYEDLLAAPASGLEAISRHLGLDFDTHSIDIAVDGSSKEAMLQRRNPSNGRTVIRLAGQQLDPDFSAKEAAIFQRIVGANLRFDFGYDYWSPLA